MIFDSVYDWVNSVPKRHCSIPIHPNTYFGNHKKRHAVTTVRQFIPHLPSGPLRKLLSLLSKYKGGKLAEILREHADQCSLQQFEWSMAETATYLVLSDLSNIGWGFRVVGNTIYMLAKTQGDDRSPESKALVRKALSETKSQQLSENGSHVPPAKPGA